MINKIPDGFFPDLQAAQAAARFSALQPSPKVDYILRINKNWLANADAAVATAWLDHGQLLLPPHPPISFTTFPDWDAKGSGGANHDWMLHNMGYLRDLCAAALNGQAKASAVVDLILNWFENAFRETGTAQFSWNDHSTAIRATHIMHVIIALQRADLITYDQCARLLEILQIHAMLLSHDRFFSKGTNHGCDQAIALLMVGSVLEAFGADSAPRKLATRRLSEEVEIAFGTDNVHVENSPAYHETMMFTSMQAMNHLRHLSDVEGTLDLGRFQAGALDFLRHIRRPDLRLPAIGDSELRPLQARTLSLLEQEQEAPDTAGALARFWPRTGYAVLRGAPDSSMPDLHLVFKCGCLSHYHRQDDDNSFVLYGLGQDWLVDGGLYIHDHGEPVREYMRGCRSHNVIFPASSTALRPRTHQRWGIDSFSIGPAGTSFAATTGMFEGATFRRRLHYDHAGRIVVGDTLRFLERAPEQLMSVWQISGDKTVETTSDGVIAHSPDGSASLRLSFSRSPANIQILTGSYDPIGGLHSEIYNTLKPCHSVLIDWGIGREISVETILEFQIAE